MCCRGSAARHRGPRSPRRRSLRHLRARGRWQRAACRCSGSAFCAPTPAEVRYAVRQRPPDAAKHPVDGSTSCPSRPCRAARQSQTRATQMRHENLKMKTEEKKNAPSNPPICVANPQHGRFYAAVTGGRHAASQAGLRHPRSTVRTAIRLGGTASERQREGVDERGQQDRTGRDRVTRAASRGEEPMASCTATAGAADQCDLLRKTLGRRSASKAEQVCVAASCSSPPEPFAGSPPSPALHRQVHVLRRSCRTFSPRALVCVSVTFLYPPRAGRTDRRLGSNPLRSARSSWRRARARRRDSVDAVRAGAPEREK